MRFDRLFVVGVLITSKPVVFAIFTVFASIFFFLVPSVPTCIANPFAAALQTQHQQTDHSERQDILEHLPPRSNTVVHAIDAEFDSVRDERHA